MSKPKIVKVEINIVGGEWQWMGVLLQRDLEFICAMADDLSDRAIEEKLANPKEQL